MGYVSFREGRMFFFYPIVQNLMDFTRRAHRIDWGERNKNT